MISHKSASKTNHKRVSSHSGTPLGVRTSHRHLDSLDSPRPELGGSHHLPPYNILCSSPLRLHLNGIFFRDSQSGVPKLCRFTLPGFWASITFFSDLRLGWSLKQSCSSLREHSNAMSHTIWRRRNQVDSWLLVVGNQIVSLTPDPSFAHNLGYRCPNGSCKAILDIYTSRPFQWHQEHPNARCFDPCNIVMTIVILHFKIHEFMWLSTLSKHSSARMFTKCSPVDL
jgi:hypothetical protein